MARVGPIGEFDQHRDYLVRIAYRMLGSFDEAEDVVHDALLRAGRASTVDVTNVEAWLTTIVTRVALDRLKSARVRREAYVGQWLPEPSIGSPWSSNEAVDPADRVTLDDEINLALITVLETLSPAERAVFVLHEAFAIPLADVATIIGRTPQACRQLAVRARRHVDERTPRFDVDRSERTRVVVAFQHACETGDLEALTELLDRDVVFRADGGGVVRAAARVEGRARVSRTLRAGLGSVVGLDLDAREVNGEPGLVARYDGGMSVFAFVVHDGRITHIDVIANPEKLRRISGPPPSVRPGRSAPPEGNPGT
jgi:RNA polymerase sigma-70 factor, ECF subfamily